MSKRKFKIKIRIKKIIRILKKNDNHYENINIHKFAPIDASWLWLFRGVLCINNNQKKMQNLKNRLIFKFYKSYYDVAQELDDENRLAFYDALMKRQFTGEESELIGMSKFAYISQKHNIDAQVKGYCDKYQKVTPMVPPMVPPTVPPTVPPMVPPMVQKEKKEYIYIDKFLNIDNEYYNLFIDKWNAYSFKYKNRKVKLTNLQSIEKIKLKEINKPIEEISKGLFILFKQENIIETCLVTPKHFLNDFYKYHQAGLEYEKTNKILQFYK